MMQRVPGAIGRGARFVAVNVWHARFYVVVVAALVVSMIVLDALDGDTTRGVEHELRVAPFLIAAIGLYLKVALVYLQQEPVDGVPWWRVWDRQDVLATYLMGSSFGWLLYSLGLAAGNSSYFDLPTAAYDTMRILLLVISLIGVPALLRLAWLRWGDGRDDPRVRARFRHVAYATIVGVTLAAWYVARYATFR